MDTGELAALVSARVISSTTLTLGAFDLVQQVNVTYDRLVLAEDSLTDETATLRSDGKGL